MKQFISWIGRRIINGIVTGIFLVATVLSVVYALSFPDTGPGGVDAGGKFVNIFNTILKSGDYKNPGDGTVKNADTVDGLHANQIGGFTTCTIRHNSGNNGADVYCLNGEIRTGCGEMTSAGQWAVGSYPISNNGCHVFAGGTSYLDVYAICCK